MEQAEKRHQVACETFGEGDVPKLETATYMVLHLQPCFPIESKFMQLSHKHVHAVMTFFTR